MLSNRRFHREAVFDGVRWRNVGEAQMRRWFLSYNSQDIALVRAFEAALRRKDGDANIFFAPKSLRIGGFWLPELAKEIAEATAFVLLVGESGIGEWQVAEYYEAYGKRVKEPDFSVILLLLAGKPAPGLPFLRQLHWIVTDDPTSEQTVAQLIDAAGGKGARPGHLWRYTAPYRGLYAMEEKDSDYFFGRTHETEEVIRTLDSTPDKLPVLLGNSGVGKSSLAQAGVLASLGRQTWPATIERSDAWPERFKESRRWCVLKLKPGTEPIRALFEPFLRIWQFDPTDSRIEARQTDWIKNLAEGRNTLGGLLDATEGRLQELGQPSPPAFLIYIDQGEELYVRAEERQRRRFSALVAEGLADPRLYALMSLRADFFGELQKDEPLYSAHRQINVPPLREAELREVVSRPAQLLSARFETERLAAQIAQRTAEESTKDAGALPLLSYLLDDTWKQMIERDDGVLRLPAQAIELGGVLVDRANSFLARHPNSEERVRRIFNLLVTVREGEEPTRRRALRSEFADEDWRLVVELADHPNRLLVTAAPEGGETYAEAAHEAIFRRWAKLREWIAAEREFLAWRSGLEASRRAWGETPDDLKDDALLMGFALSQAQRWRSRRAGDIPERDLGFIERSSRTAAKRVLRVQALVGLLGAIILTGVFVWWRQPWLEKQLYWLTDVRGHALSAQAEFALEPLRSFTECTDCPELVVLPPGEYMMGSSPREVGHVSDEEPEHTVKIVKPFAVSKYDVTNDEWDLCVKQGGCTQSGYTAFGRGRRPVTNISWNEARQYVVWLEGLTGRPYRLLSEAEWEYAARAGTATRFFFGDDDAVAGTYVVYYLNSGHETKPVGTKHPNAFGLFDMYGNVWQWCEDPSHPNYRGAPVDGSAWQDSDTSLRILRGGSWYDNTDRLRSAGRNREPPSLRAYNIGFRVARTLATRGP